MLVPPLAPAHRMYGSGLSSAWERNEWARSAAGVDPPLVGRGRMAYLPPQPKAKDTEGAPQAPEASAVSTGAPITTTNQGPTQAGSHPAPQ